MFHDLSFFFNTDSVRPLAHPFVHPSLSMHLPIPLPPIRCRRRRIVVPPSRPPPRAGVPHICIQFLSATDHRVADPFTIAHRRCRCCPRIPSLVPHTLSPAPDSHGRACTGCSASGVCVSGIKCKCSRNLSNRGGDGDNFTRLVRLSVCRHCWG
jgi:hypothetical protein